MTTPHEFIIKKGIFRILFSVAISLFKKRTGLKKYFSNPRLLSYCGRI